MCIEPSPQPHAIAEASTPDSPAPSPLPSATVPTTPSLGALSDDELLRRLSTLVRDGRRGEAALVAHLAELDERRLYARAAVPSLFAYCTDVLRFSEPEACLRIAAARASRRHPLLLDMLADGRIHLSGIATLAPHLNTDNRNRLLARATHRSKRQIEELIAETFPRADVPDRIRRLPPRASGESLANPRTDVPTGAAPAAAGLGLTLEVPMPDASESGRVGSAGVDATLRDGGSPRLDWVKSTRSEGVDASAASTIGAPEDGVGPSERRRASVEPIAAGRFKVQFTASATLREKLERLQALMSSGRSQTSLAAVIEAAVEEKLARLEAKRFGETTRPRTMASGVESRRSPGLRGTPSDAPGSGAPGERRRRSRYIPAAIRREVWRRDAGQCRFVDGSGRRCTARRGLQFHHVHPFALGGEHRAEDLRLFCGTHNRYVAEIDYGRRLPRASRDPGSPRPGVVGAGPAPTVDG